jgi:hypothetical protein
MGNIFSLFPFNPPIANLLCNIVLWGTLPQFAFKTFYVIFILFIYIFIIGLKIIFNYFRNEICYSVTYLGYSSMKICCSIVYFVFFE